MEMITTRDAAVPTDMNVAELYRALSGRLAQIVRLNARVPEQVVEDACQFAWARLVGYAPGLRRECALSWLVTTAVREANRLARWADRELLLDPAAEATGALGVGLRAPACDDTVERRERLTLIRQLPERQQRLLWLQALGLSYDEMALYTGYSRRTVERQLLRARHRLRALAAD
jgi:RNA polymerase sigma factor (sigma-70 family)